MKSLLPLLLLCAACGPAEPTLTLLQLGTAGEDQGVAIGLDRHGATADGSPIVGGFTLGARQGFSNAGGSDAFLLKLDPEGETVWELQWGTSESEEVAGLTLTPAGDLVVAGSTLGAMVADGSWGDRDVFVARVGRDGTPTW